MTIDEAIKHAEEVAEENQKVVDTGIIYDDVTIYMLYCDDTEVIEEHLANYQRCAEEHQQLAEWLKELKTYKENEPKTGHWISHREHCENLGVMPSGLGAYKWCSNCDCGIDVGEWHRNHYNYCPNCGAKMKEV